VYSEPTATALSTAFRLAPSPRVTRQLSAQSPMPASARTPVPQTQVLARATGAIAAVV
jgi:hypothetical protein